MQLFKLNLIILLATACSFLPHKPNEEKKSQSQLNDDQLLDTIQYRTFQYFWDGAELNSGMACERIHTDGVYPENDKNVGHFRRFRVWGNVDRGWNRSRFLLPVKPELDVWQKLLRFSKKQIAFMVHGHTGCLAKPGKLNHSAPKITAAILLKQLT